MKEQSTGHALVIGGSIAGLVTARVLADRFERVTVLDRDAFPAPGKNRKGIPQGKHAHGLLAQGLGILEELFPGLTSTLVEAGTPNGDLAARVRWHHDGRHCRYASGMKGVVASRPFLESHIRERVRQLENVRLLDRTEAMDLLMDPSGRRVVGLKIRDAYGTPGELRADLVVDAAGRGSRLPLWIARAGYEAPEEEQVHVGLTYATRTYLRRPVDLNGDMAVIIGPSPDNRRGAAMVATQDGTWTVTLYGYFDHAPSGETAGFEEFARKLAAPDCYDVIRTAQALDDVTVIRFAAHRRQRYERLKRFPQRLVALGDAVCSSNPIYGQGMTSACMQAAALRELLDGDLDDIGPRCFAAVSTIIDGPWSIATGGDLRLPGVIGERTLATRLVNWYVGKLHIAARSDPAVALAFLKVANLMERPASLMKPMTALRVLQGNLRRRPATRMALQGS